MAPLQDKKTFPAPNLENVPPEMKASRRWIVWKLEPRKGSDKLTKPPYDAKTGLLAEPDNPATWSSFDEAVEAYNKGGYAGLGFFMGWDEEQGINFCGVDLDHLEGPDDWSRVRQLAARFDTYAEISPSEAGIHIISLGKKDGPKCKKGNIEIYDHGRYFTFTGNLLDNKFVSVKNCEPVLREFYKEVFGIDSPQGINPTKPHVLDSSPATSNPAMKGPQREELPSLSSVALSGFSDDQIIERLMNDKNGPKFKKLFSGDTSDYSSPSEADSGYAAMVRFYTRDPAQIKRIMLRSELKREKWDRKDYLDRTVGNVLKKGEKENWTVWTPPMLRGYAPSPNGNADRFVDMFGEGVLYRIKGKDGTWLLWNKNIWKPDNTLEIENMGREIPKVLYMEAAHIGDEDKRRKANRFAVVSDSIGQVRAMLDAVKSDRQIARYYRDFDQNPFIVGLPGSEGVILELTETGYRFRQARKEDMVTLCCSTVPATREDKREPTEWEAFLNLIFVKKVNGKLEPDKDLIRYIQKLMGYSLLGRQDQQAFFVFYGDGSNGKSTLLRVWALILGMQDYATYPDVGTFGKKLSEKEIRSDLAAIMKQRVVFVVEGDKQLKLNITLINRWTGGQEPLTFRDLYEKTVSEQPQGTLVMAVNNRPLITDSNYGIWRRVRLVPFLVNLDVTLKGKKRENYADEMYAREGDLIFRWMLQGYELYKKEGLQSPSSVDEATKKYKSESNTVFLFANDMLKEEIGATIMASDLIEKYAEYCTSEELEKIRTNEFRAELKKFYEHNMLIGFTRTTKGMVWHGIKFKNENDFLNE